MEQIPAIRTIGRAAPEKHAEAIVKIHEALVKHIASLSKEDREVLKKLEYSKSPLEIQLITLANEVTNHIIQPGSQTKWQ